MVLDVEVKKQYEQIKSRFISSNPVRMHGALIRKKSGVMIYPDEAERIFARNFYFVHIDRDCAIDESLIDKIKRIIEEKGVLNLLSGKKANIPIGILARAKIKLNYHYDSDLNFYGVLRMMIQELGRESYEL